MLSPVFKTPKEIFSRRGHFSPPVFHRGARRLCGRCQSWVLTVGAGGTWRGAGLFTPCLVMAGGIPNVCSDSAGVMGSARRFQSAWHWCAVIFYEQKKTWRPFCLVLSAALLRARLAELVAELLVCCIDSECIDQVASSSPSQALTKNSLSRSLYNRVYCQLRGHSSACQHVK